ncbi:major facilitator superfamily MFS_1 [Streptomyces bingchenggensis BCW-1]|uniref:Major facilitator superfamily MFS_1 n=1 Tax=Streptomyces bingchenggensis (strain BCW-1) TaxID=749414 RepID=D7C174_STRBB|nr:MULTISPECIES: MFS transporter [Streptomyces]ADI07975.1 major facilitator superfamily MFS_1 [Streptomyces bingchenggensis BCW-1]
MLAFNRVVRNIGATLSTPALGVALALDSPVAFRSLIGVGAVSVLIVALIATRLPDTTTPTEPIPDAAGPRKSKRSGVLRDRPYLALSLLNGVLVMHMELLEIGMPLWGMNRTQAPAWTTSALLFTNVLVAIGFQMRVGHTVTDVNSAARAMRRGGYCLLSASAVFALTGTLTPLLCATALFSAVVLLTLTELLQSAGSWGLSYDLADTTRLGEYQGAWSVGTQLVRSCGPFLVTLVLSTLDAAGWLVIGLIYAVAAACAAPLSRRAEATRHVTAPQAATPQPTPTKHTVPHNA